MKVEVVTGNKKRIIVDELRTILKEEDGKGFITGFRIPNKNRRGKHGKRKT